MDLNSILEKTKDTSDRIKRTREPVYIATEDRPYEVMPEYLKTEQIKTTNKVATNSKQITNKLVTNCKQSDNKENEKWKQTINKVVTQPVTEVETNCKQSDNKVVTNYSFSAMVGLQRFILILIYQECKKSLSKITDPLTMEYIVNQVNSDKNTIKTTIYRLEAKGCLLRKESKHGRGGWTRYALSNEIYQDMLHSETVNKLITNCKQSDNKVVAQPITELVTSLSSSSSLINNKETTTTGEENKLTDDWITVDIEPLQNIGFTITHLNQIAKQGILSAEIVQGSINAFAFDLVYNKKITSIKGNPLNYFMGIIRNGQPYAPPANYESPQDRDMRKYLERQREIEEVRKAREEELIKLAFSEWENEQSEEDKQALLPPEIRASKLSAAKTASLRAYFVREIWPLKRKKLLENFITDNA